MTSLDAPALRWDQSPIVSQPLADIVADRIVRAVTTGHLKSGDRLIEGDLAATFGVSRVPVREALRILRSQGLVGIAPHRGATLIQFDEDWADVTRGMRVNLERMAARKAALVLRRKKAALAELEEAIEDIGKAMTTGDLLKVNTADLAYHRVLHDLAASPLLSAMCAAMERHVEILFSIDVQRLKDKKSFVHDHERLTQVLARGSDRDIDSAVDAHVLWMHHE